MFYVYSYLFIFNFRCHHWLLICKRLDLLSETCEFVNENYAVCSDHFIASQFTDEKKHTLKNGAIPTLFNFSNQIIPVEIIDDDQIIVEGKFVLFFSSFL